MHEINIGLVFFGFWICAECSVFFFRYLTSRDLYHGLNKRVKRLDGSYWGVYPDSTDQQPVPQKSKSRTA